MNWIHISEREKADSIFAKVDWPHSFVREAYIVSPSYIIPGKLGVVAPDCLPSARLFLSSVSSEIPGVEFLFVEVEEFSVWFGGDLEPDISISVNSIKLRLNKSHAPIVSKNLYYKYLETDSWGNELRYGWESVYSTGGELSIP